MENGILLLGDGGHCRSVLDSLAEDRRFGGIGIVARDGGAGGEVSGVPVVGGDKDLPRLRREGYRFAFLAVGSVGDTRTRRRLYALAAEAGFEFPVIADPTAAVGRAAVLGPGCFIGKNAVVNANAVIGGCAIVNSGAVVEHDCLIGEFAHISPGAVVCGGTEIGPDAHIGAGACVRQGVRVGAGALIGMGSVVLRDIPAGTVAYGNPCREIGRTEK